MPGPLSLLEFQMMTELSKMTGKTVLAGDQRQECFADCGHFAKMWCDVNESELIGKIHLVNNYRSCSGIVSVLNMFAARHFPNIGGSEPLISKRGKCSVAESGHQCLQIYNCNGNVQMGNTMAAHVSSLPRGRTAYAVSPVSVNSYGNEVTSMALRDGLTKAKMSAEATETSTGGERGESAPSDTNRLNICAPSHEDLPIATSMKLKGGEADLVLMFGLDVDYSLDRFTWNRQLKLLYVALSRARNAVTVYLCLDLCRETRMHVSLEGSVLTERRERVYKAARSVDPRAVPPRDMRKTVECRGLDSDGNGGLCAFNLATEVKSGGSVGSCICVPRAFSSNRVILHLLSKELAKRGLKFWVKSLAGHRVGEDNWEGAIYSASVASVSRKLKEKCPNSWNVLDHVKVPPGEAATAERSSVMFGHATFTALMKITSYMMGSRGVWKDEADRVSAETEPLATIEAEEGMDGAGDETETSARDLLVESRDSMDLSDVSIDATCPHEDEVTFNSDHTLFHLTCNVDALMRVTSSGIRPKRRVIPVIFYVGNSVLPRSALTRASMCGAVCGSIYGVVVNCCTGDFALVQSSQMSILSLLTRGSLLGEWCCFRGSKVAKPPKCLQETTSLVILHCHVGIKDSRLCVVILSQFGIVNAASWSTDGDAGKVKAARIKLSNWLNERPCSNSFVTMFVDDRTRCFFGDVQVGTKTVHMKDLLREAGVRLPPMPNVSSALDQYLTILKLTCGDLSGVLSRNSCFDACIAAVCIIKSTFDWDTSV